MLERGEDRVQANGRRRATWVCQCACGKIVTVMGDNLKAGKTISCGCYRHDYLVASHTTHGEAESRLYAIWQSMKHRCNNPRTKAYKDYGGRGIHVCEEWQDSYEAFRDWSIANGYSEDLSIDRIDNNGNYEPANCRWITDAAQASNRRSNRLYTLDGETHTLTEWANIKGLNPKTVFNRIYTGWDFEEAITTPPLQ